MTRMPKRSAGTAMMRDRNDEPAMPARSTKAGLGRPVARQFTVRRLAPVPDTEPATPIAAERPTKAGPARPSRRTFLVLVALLAVAIVALVWTGRRWHQGDQLVGAHQAAVAAAKQTTVDFVSISAATVDRDLQRIAAGATGDFKEEFTRGMPQVRQAVVENKVQSTGTVLRAALVSGDRDSAVVLVAIDASVKNAGAPDGRLSHYRMQVDLALDPESGRWLVSRLQFVG